MSCSYWEVGLESLVDPFNASGTQNPYHATKLDIYCYITLKIVELYHN